MQKFEFLRQPLLGELAMSRKRERKKKEEKKNAIYSGHLRFCLQPRAAHALCSDQFFSHCNRKSTIFHIHFHLLLIFSQSKETQTKTIFSPSTKQRIKQLLNKMQFQVSTDLFHHLLRNVNILANRVYIKTLAIYNFIYSTSKN